MKQTQESNESVILKCQGCGYDFNLWVVRYYSDEMHEADLICPHCQSRNFTKSWESLRELPKADGDFMEERPPLFDDD